ncbi:MAG TPA: hypothetical protein VGP22_09740 [Albitalea sp.]|jgi:phospholipase/lecithinase/hemolysin|nr:hypothetical protein [Albitalea sp.]
MSWVDGWRVVALRAAGIALTATLLASCGGGEQVRKFVPTRVIAFGDESSLLEPDGSKYSINSQPSATSPTLDCEQLPIWVQSLATAHGIPFPQCAAAGVAAPSLMRAVNNANVDAVSGQVDTFLAQGNTFSGTDLVTVLAGTHDVVDIQTRVENGTITMDQGRAEAIQAGTRLANVVNRIALAGGKVLISTIPNVALTPYGRVSTARSQILTTLSDEFNSNLRIGLINDGRMIGLMLTHESINAIANSGTYNSTSVACDVAKTLGDLRKCTTQTMLVTNGVTAVPGTWLWADDLHMGPVGQSTLGSLAISRVTTNPF